MDVTYSDNKKKLSWDYKGKRIEKHFKYPIVETAVSTSFGVYVIAYYKEVNDSRNVFVFELNGTSKEHLLLPFSDIKINSFDAVDANEDGTLTFYLDTISGDCAWETRVNYDPVTKMYSERNICK